MIAQRALTSSSRAAAGASSSRSLATSSAVGRQALLRAAPKPSSSLAFPRRNASSSSSSNSSSGSSSSPAAAVQKLTSSNDSIWAISSVLVFGALFIYLTSPSGKGHAKGHTPQPHKKDDDFPTNDEAFEGLSKTEDQKDSHLAGNKALAERAHAPDSEGAPTQKKTKDAPTPRHDNTTFQHGVAAAKDGNHISDPKSVVASAKTAKEDKANKKQEKKDSKDAEKKEADEAAEEANKNNEEDGGHKSEEEEEEKEE